MLETLQCHSFVQFNASLLSIFIFYETLLIVLLVKISWDIQWVRKVFRPPSIFHSLLYCSHLLKSFKFIFFLINVHTAPHIDRKTQNFWHFCRFIKKEKLKYHMVLSIQTLCCDTHIFNSISSDHPWDGSAPSFESSCVWLYWLDLIRKATHLSI